VAAWVAAAGRGPAPQRRAFRLELAQDPGHAQAAAWLGDVLLQRDESQAA